MNRRLGLESLESRDLMAGNLTVTQTAGGDLRIIGDAAANIFTLVQTGAGKYQVTGTSTNVNGSATAKTFSGITRHIIIDTLAGNDRVTIGRLATAEAKNTTRILGDMSVKTGTGADLLSILNVVGKNSKAVMGTNLENEIDKITVKSSNFSGNAVLQTGGGNDVIVVNNSKAFTSLTVDLGAGNDTATLTNGTVGNITLNCGTGNDKGIFVGRFKSTGIIKADGGLGTDTADLDGVVSYDVSDPDPEFKNFEPNPF